MSGHRKAEDPAVDVPAGRPSGDEERERLRQIVFMAGRKIDEALEDIIADLGERGTQSVAIREAILEKAERVRAKRKERTTG